MTQENKTPDSYSEYVFARQASDGTNLYDWRGLIGLELKALAHVRWDKIK